MKKIIKLAFYFFIAGLSLNTTAQQLDTKTSNAKAPKENDSEHKMNIIKLNVSGISLRNYTVQYERVLTRKTSVALGIRLMPNGGLPSKKSLRELADGDVDFEKVIDNARIGNFAITPEFRFYTGKKGYGRGFYLAPYYRYARFNGENIPIDYSGGTTTKTIMLQGNLNTHSGGLMIGAQWWLTESFSLDWWIIGGQYGIGKGTFTGTTSIPLTQTEQADIRQTISDFDLPFGKVTSEVNANTIKAVYDGSFAGLRAGLTIGFRF